MYLDRAIALLIYRGVRTPKEIAGILRLNEDDVLVKLREMESKGLIKCGDSGFWIFKRFRCLLSDEGLKLAREAFKELERRAEELRRRLNEVNDERRQQEVINELIALDPIYLHLIPLMLWMNLLVLPLPLLTFMYGLDDASMDGDVGELM